VSETFTSHHSGTRNPKTLQKLIFILRFVVVVVQSFLMSLFDDHLTSSQICDFVIAAIRQRKGLQKTPPLLHLLLFYGDFTQAFI